MRNDCNELILILEPVLLRRAYYKEFSKRIIAKDPKFPFNCYGILVKDYPLISFCLVDEDGCFKSSDAIKT